MRANRERQKQLLAEALELLAPEREDFLLRAAADDRALLSRLRQLVRAASSAHDFLEVPVARDPARYLPELFGLAAGTRVGSFEIERVIGFGGTSIVYAAWQTRPRRRVALKVFATDLSQQGVRRRFEHEAELLARLRHPAIAQVHAAATLHECGVKTPYLAVEWIAGARSITAWAREQAPAREALIECFLQVCCGVQHGHERGVVHRDLKPENVLVDEEGQPKIVDFGIARLSDPGTPDSSATPELRITRTGEIVGTLPYMSPEQCSGWHSPADRRSDVYALGVLLYELLLGRLPFDFADLPLAGAFHAIVNEAPRRPSSVQRGFDQGLEAVLLKSLEKDPARRYPSAAEFARDLDR